MQVSERNNVEVVEGNALAIFIDSQTRLVSLKDTNGVVSSLADELGGNVSGSGTATQVAFWSGTSTVSGDNGLYWDNVNKRLGIGTAFPSAMLHVDGQVRFRNTVQLAQQNNNSFAGENTGNLGTIVGSKNTGFGKNIMSSTTLANNNSALGFEALGSITTGNRNVAIGVSALGNSVTNNGNNVAIGYESLLNASGADNIAMGSQSLFTQTSGTDNIAIGKEALYSQTTVSKSIAIGGRALFSNTTGSYNIAIGDSALTNINLGINRFNIAIGRNAGSDLTGTGGENNIIIGDLAQASTPTVSNEITIGNSNHDKLRIVGIQQGASDGDLLTYNSTSETLELLPLNLQATANPSTPSADNVGTLRYRTTANASFLDVVLQTGVASYQWVNIISRTW
jgi:hypothetical protein